MADTYRGGNVFVNDISIETKGRWARAGAMPGAKLPYLPRHPIPCVQVEA